jgi:transposase
MNHSEFRELFPDDDACFDYLKARFYPDGSRCVSCGRATKFHRIRGRSAYSCQFCGHHVYPTAGTILHRSTTSPRLWFWAIFLMSSTRCQISTRQLERELGVTYKTAHRMRSQIRRSLLPEEERTAAPASRETDSETERSRAAPPPMNLRRRLRLSERS